MGPKDSDGTANSVDPKSVTFVYSVRSDLSVRKRRIITYI